VLLILAPGYDLIFVAAPKKSWIVVLWFLCAVAGAVFGAFAITQQRASAARRALPSFISAVLIGMAIMAASALASHHDIGVPLSFCWRASGTLVLPAGAHALIDSYRNCVQ
jgi:uncharacterized membrane protein